jgi:hypothetical protein
MRAGFDSIHRGQLEAAECRACRLYVLTRAPICVLRAGWQPTIDRRSNALHDSASRGRVPAFGLELEIAVYGHFAGHAAINARHMGKTKTPNWSVSHE